jgi:ATP-binding cassette subfamily C protein CydC
MLLILSGFALPIALNRLASPLAQKEVLAASQMRSYCVEFTQGIGELLIFNAQQEKISQLKSHQTTWFDAQTRLHKIRTLGGSVQGFLAHMALWSIILICTPLVTNNILSGPQLAMLSLLSLAAFEAVAPLPLAFTSWAELKEAMNQLESISDQKALRFEPIKTAAIPTNADITLNKVSFTYPKSHTQTLNEISLTFPYGTRSLITGNSGSGKSTLLQIIEALYPASFGSCLIGNIDINHINSDQWRSKISVISQQPQLINGSLADNLRLAKPDATDTELLVALNKAALGDFIDTLPDGLDTWLGDTGAKVSGGQARRISITQAFLKDAPLWLLDEPTEGLDQSTSSQLIKLLDQHLTGRTAIIVSHQRLPGLHIDQHFVMRNGQLTQQH